MSNLHHGPKIRSLTNKETIASLEGWKASVLYGLRLNPEFRPYLRQGFEFGRKSRANPYRSLTPDIRVMRAEDTDDDDQEEVVQTVEEKCGIVDLLLEQISNYAPTVPRNDIVKDSKDLKEVWTKIKLPYNKQQAGSLLNECWKVKREPDETPQALFSRMKQLYDENLLTVGGLYYIDSQATEDEEMSPTLHNTIILQWLEILHPQLRDLVTQRFITQLRENTYATLFPEISRSVEALLEELHGEATASRLQPSFNKNPSYQPYQSNQKPHQNSNPYRTSFRGKPNSRPNYQGQRRFCDFCRVTGKTAFKSHTIEQCLFIKKLNQSSNASANQVECEEPDQEEIDQHYEEFYSYQEDERDQSAMYIEHIISKISMEASPVLTLSKDNEPHDLTLDSGASCSCMSKRKAKQLKAKIHPTNQRVRMADGQSNLEVIGETDVILYRNNKPYYLSAVVCEHMDTDILAGMTFMKRNDVAIRPATDEIILNGNEFIKYDSTRKTRAQARRVTSYMVKSESRQVIMPGESANFNIPNVTGSCVIEPRWDAHCNKNVSKDNHLWPQPQIVRVEKGQITVTNPQQKPIILKKSDHIFQIQPEIDPNQDGPKLPPATITPMHIPSPNLKYKKRSLFSAHVSLNPDNLLTKEEEDSFSSILSTYDSVFDPEVPGYNGKSGPCYVEVNIGSNLPPQRKGRVPFYGRDNLVDLQNKFDELEAKGILSRPQEIGVTIENTNPSFLVNKQPPSTEKRLVTDFTSIADFCRPTPSLMPNVESVLKSIGSWKYLAKTDMSMAYHQIRMKKSSQKYCGVHTPYKGLLVYNVGVMGLPGVEVALEELTCLILGDMVKEGKVAKIADDLFIGGNSPEELKSNLQEVLIKLHENNIKLKASKTTVAPKEVTILGWIWNGGKLRASSHRLLALSTCTRPDTVTAMRSYLGAYRFLSRTLHGYARLLSPLEDLIKGKDAKEKLIWSESLIKSFEQAQQALSGSKAVTIPQSSDTLCIVTDASVRPGALGAILYAIRNGQPLLAGFYNCKLPEFQLRWLPCELEALAIASALNHFSPYIIQSQNKPQVATDSKPCVDAVEKLKRGQFSASARLSTFLSAVSRFQAKIQHIAGAKNIPSDYLSRHPLHCTSPKCSVCTFVSESMEAVVQHISVEDITEGRVSMPFTNRNTWGAVQNECKDLRKVKLFRKQGTTPSKKSKQLRQVRRYLSSGVLLGHDDTLIQPHSAPLRPSSERIVVPQQVLHGILTVLHLKFNHPTAHQLTKVFSQYFFALNLDKSVTEVSKSCSQCASIREIPRAMIKQTTDTPPQSVGVNFAADIIKRCGQKILTIRETVSSYTLAELIQDETAKAVSESLVRQCNILCPSSATNIKIRVDPASAHESLFKRSSKDSILAKNCITLEIGRHLNKNKNAVVDKCIKEIHRELLIINPAGGQISQSTLSEAIANLNSRYRRSGLSAHEIWTQRDQLTGEQLPINDRELILQQNKQRQANHPYSEKSKAFGKPYNPKPNLKIGSLVYLYTDRDKTKARPRYLVTKVSEDWCKLRRFTTTLLGGKEYDARLEECYQVPHIDNLILPNLEEEESSDSDNYTPDERDPIIPTLKKTPARTLDREIRQSDSNESSESSDNEEHDDDEQEDSPDLDNDRDSEQEELQDPNFVPPKNTTPAVMERGRRENRAAPDRYGDWVKFVHGVVS